MSYKAGTIRLITKGTMAGIQDFSFGLAFDTTFASLPTYTDLSVWASAVAAHTTTFATSMAALSSTSLTYTGVRAEYYDGAPTATIIAEAPTVAPVVGTGSADQCSRAAVVVGLQTDRPGRSYAGRVYIPVLRPVMTTSLRVPAATQTTTRTALRTYAKAIESVLLSTPLGSVTPRLVVASKLLGTSRPVTIVRTDDLLDTQRRRENDFAPLYTNAAY